ncbi:MAG: hypothetical protein O7C01_03355 [Actinobacteria bacterium]|nr:hypothetical protein [Actinomycetota bacterium]
MARTDKTEFDPEAIAGDVSALLTTLAGVSELGARIEIHFESAEPLRRITADVVADARTLAKETLEKRVESVGVEDAAIEEARKPVERVPIQDADHSAVIGSITDVKSGAGISGGHVVAKTRDGQVIGEAPIDALGNFAVELEANPEEVQIEAFDEDGKSVSISTLELEEAETAAYFVEMVSAAKQKAPTADGEARLPVVTRESRPEKADKSAHLKRIRRAALESDTTDRPFIQGNEKS